jgi:hypothetical protein
MRREGDSRKLFGDVFFWDFREWRVVIFRFVARLTREGRV